MATGRVLVTTAWLEPDDLVHKYLTDAGLEVHHSSVHDRAETGVELSDVVEGFDAIIAGTDPFTDKVLSAASTAKILARTGVGYDNVDVDAATRLGIAVCPTPGINRQSVAEHTIGLLLGIARRIPQNNATVLAGGWEQKSGRELNGATLGIVGLGAIGRSVAEIAIALGMKIVAFDPYIDHKYIRAKGIHAVDLDELLGTSDFVSLHLFLSQDTHHLINAAALAKMKNSAYLINAARGGIVDEEALAAVLADGRLAGAALDTLEHEPLPAESPLRRLDNVIITAHIGAATIESRARSGMMAAESVVEALEGRMPAHAINRQLLAEWV